MSEYYAIIYENYLNMCAFNSGRNKIKTVLVKIVGFWTV